MISLEFSLMLQTPSLFYRDLHTLNLSDGVVSAAGFFCAAEEDAAGLFKTPALGVFTSGLTTPFLGSAFGLGVTFGPLFFFRSASFTPAVGDKVRVLASSSDS